MKEFTVATEALELLTSREAWEYRLIPFEIKGDLLECYGEKGYDYGGFDGKAFEGGVFGGRRVL